MKIEINSNRIVHLGSIVCHQFHPTFTNTPIQINRLQTDSFHSLIIKLPEHTLIQHTKYVQTDTVVVFDKSSDKPIEVPPHSLHG